MDLPEGGRQGISTRRTAGNLARQWRTEPVKNVSLTAEPFECIRQPNGIVKEFTINIDDSARLVSKPHCIAGRATSVFPLPDLTSIQVPSTQTLSGEVPTTRNYVWTGQTNANNYIKNLPSLPIWSFVQFTDPTAATYNLVIRASRVTQLLIFEELKPIHKEVTGLEFIKAWAEVVKCHRFLHECGFEHSDPSLWNMMYDVRRRCGVLTDFDLALPPGSSTPAGFERTGTVPFMSLELLTPAYWDGKILRRYRHVLEALIWVLVFVLMTYNDKKLGEDRMGTGAWTTSNYLQCAKEKDHFLLSGEFIVQNSFGGPEAELASELIGWLGSERLRLATATRPGRAYRQHAQLEAIQVPLSSKQKQVQEDKEVWDKFTEVILSVAQEFTMLSEVSNILN
ncbi:unnamed protein product [Cyclocybe aegerita]|uniref:Fungal-type protein kinase domain-containing protein n=1 Tax=Cyclocybe aegerita TaxID=1973307 RepID=A0A8S0WSK1_CYCAE|nr:unnamed protein product [Cyclocybe aegerita]